MDLLSRLSTSQYEAATTLDVPVCILAGAGTGKTRVITHRIAYLVDAKHVYPESILAVTFTNKAAKEMRERVDRLLPGMGHRVVMGTFHGLAARFLRRLGHYIKIPSDFLIYDADDSERLLKRIATEEMGIAKDRVQQVISQIEHWQTAGFTPETIPGQPDIFQQKNIAIFKRYEQQMATMGALSFDGLLKKWRELLLQPDAYAHIMQHITHIMVDEYQDTNLVQADIVHLLARQAHSIAIVGDDDQSIYGWRGASPHNMQVFLNKMPNAKLVRLEENYRSTDTILQAANHVIAKNTTRIGKNLQAVQAGGDKVQLMRAESDIAEGSLVVRLARQTKANTGSFNNCAVLMRTNAQSRPIEDALRRASIPYRLYGGMKFYDRKEVKDVLATLRAALQPNSDVDVIRSLVSIPRGIGDTSLQKARKLAQEKGISLLAVLSDEVALEEAGLAARTRKKTVEFAQGLVKLNKQLVRQDPQTQVSIYLDADQAIVLAIEVSQIAERLQTEDTAEADERLDNLSQLVSAARQYVEEAKQNSEPSDVFTFLQTTSLLSSSETVEGAQDESDAVTLMTLHAAKGLEFDTVIMVGMEDYGFPHARALEEGAPTSALEEERRLAYVGITRAKRQLYLTYAQRRMVRGSVMGRVPSRFMRDIPGHIAEGDKPGFLQTTPIRTEGTTTIALDPEYSPRASQQGNFEPGTRVCHQAFGVGTVVNFRGMGSLQRVMVRFDADKTERVIVARHLTMA